MKTSKALISLAIGVMALTLVVPVCSQPSFAQTGKKVFLGFAGGPSAGSAVMDSVAAVAGLLNKKLPNLNVTPESSAGGAENVRRVHSKQTDMAGAFSADMYEGYHGKGMFQGQPQENIRGVGVLYCSYTHVVVLKSSGIKTIADLRGKKVAVGGQGMGTALLSERLFKEMGMWDKIRVSYLGGNDSTQALKDGHIDAFIWSPGIPGPTIVDISSVKSIVLLDIVSEAQKVRFFEKYPYYAIGEIPANTYKGVDYAVAVILSSANWIVHKETSPELVYEMAKVAYSDEGVKYLSSTYKPLKEMGNKKVVLSGIHIPLHPGAERYWKEIGLTIPETVRAK